MNSSHLTNENNKKLIEQIDALLPQTQCGQCGYGACLPYAKAMVEKNEAINRCPPGGIKTLKALANALNKDPTPFIAAMKKQEKPAKIAYIRESECIGCTKCIQACPVDAILGAAKQLHTVLVQECTGCELCIAPCPVDCIDMVTTNMPSYQPQKARQRFQEKKIRLKKAQQLKLQYKKAEELNSRRNYIAAAVARVQAKQKTKYS